MGKLMQRERASFSLDAPAVPGVSRLVGTTVAPAHERLRIARATPFGHAAERAVDLALAVFATPAALACFTSPPATPMLVQHGLDPAIGRAEWQVLARRSGACVVRDATAEAWLARHPLVTGRMRMRFYAAAPLRDRLGRQHGVLAILAPEPRPQGLTPEECARLQSLADMLMAEGRADAPPDEALQRAAEAECALRQCEQQLRNQAHLIQEMDHRIRNSLQMVSDMLCLQALAGAEEGLAARLNAAAGASRRWRRCTRRCSAGRVPGCSACAAASRTCCVRSGRSAREAAARPASRRGAT